MWLWQSWHLIYRREYEADATEPWSSCQHSWVWSEHKQNKLAGTEMWGQVMVLRQRSRGVCSSCIEAQRQPHHDRRWNLTVVRLSFKMPVIGSGWWQAELCPLTSIYWNMNLRSSESDLFWRQGFHRRYQTDYGHWRETHTPEWLVSFDKGKTPDWSDFWVWSPACRFKKTNTVARDEAETDRSLGSLNSWVSLPVELQAGKRAWLKKQKIDGVILTMDWNSNTQGYTLVSIYMYDHSHTGTHTQGAVWT